MEPQAHDALFVEISDSFHLRSKGLSLLVLAIKSVRLLRAELVTPLSHCADSRKSYDTTMAGRYLSATSVTLSTSLVELFLSSSSSFSFIVGMIPTVAGR